MPARYSIGYAKIWSSVYGGRSSTIISAPCRFIQSLSRRGTETQRNLLVLSSPVCFRLLLAQCLCVSVASLSIAVQTRGDHFRGRCARAGSAADRRRKRIGNIAGSKDIRHKRLLLTVDNDVTALIQLQLPTKQFRVGRNADAD